MAEPRRERKVVTILFCDLVSFTSRAESMDPEDVLHRAGGGALASAQSESA
jgi:class 3 adenylate cyclase